MATSNSFDTLTELRVGRDTLQIYSLPALEHAGFGRVARLPYSLKILLENLLRQEDGRFVKAEDIEALARWKVGEDRQQEIAFTPTRVLLQDFTGVPAVVDLAAMRDGIAGLGGDPARVNPLQPVELVIDHSVQVDYFGRPDAFRLNADLEFSRNRERYAFLRWGQNAFRNFRVVPPDTGIVHQVNLEYLARVVCREEVGGTTLAFPDTLIGTDSHTTMVNGLGVVGWGVGGIEAEAAMLGQPISMLVPDVLGFRLIGQLADGVTATDLVLTITERLRQYGVVGKFVEFFGPGLAHLTLADRATLGNMSPEYGATIAIFPIDHITLEYLRLTGRDERHVRLVEAYARAQGLFRDSATEAEYGDTLDLDLETVEPSVAGPRRPQDRVLLSQAKPEFERLLSTVWAGATGRDRAVAAAPTGSSAAASARQPSEGVAVADPASEGLDHGAVVVAAITSCTNTSNPSVMIGAGLLAKNAVQRGLTVKPWVKTSLAPGSLVVVEYLKAAGLLEYLDQLGFSLVGYGCTTCIGNSGPLPEAVSAAITDRNLVVASVLSGNRNFEGRIQPQVRANYLASPPLVVAYALAGRMTVDLTSESLGRDGAGRHVFLRDIWPSAAEIQRVQANALRAEMFTASYAGVFEGDERWRGLPAPEGQRFAWESDSTYIRQPPFFEGLAPTPAPLDDIHRARVLAVLGDSITTDHISPAGSIPADSPAGQYLIAQGVEPRDFNSYGARRGNHEVMVRGTFANIRLRNQLAPGTEGGWTRLQPEDELLTIFDAAMRYEAAGIPSSCSQGRSTAQARLATGRRRAHGCSGSRRSWRKASSGFIGAISSTWACCRCSSTSGERAQTLGLTGREHFDLTGIAHGLAPRGEVTVRAQRDDGSTVTFAATVRIDTPEELEAFRHGGILPYVLRQLVT